MYHLEENEFGDTIVVAEQVITIVQRYPHSGRISTIVRELNPGETINVNLLQNWDVLEDDE